MNNDLSAILSCSCRSRDSLVTTIRAQGGSQMFIHILHTFTNKKNESSILPSPTQNHTIHMAIKHSVTTVLSRDNGNLRSASRETCRAGDGSLGAGRGKACPNRDRRPTGHTASIFPTRATLPSGPGWPPALKASPLSMSLLPSMVVGVC